MILVKVSSILHCHFDLFSFLENVMLEIGNIAVCVPGERMWDILLQGEGSPAVLSSVKQCLAVLSSV